MTKLIAFSLLAVLAMPVAAQDVPVAQHAAPICPRDAEPIPLALAGWAKRMPLAAVSGAGSLDTAVATPGLAVDLMLVDTPAVAYPVRPAHPGEASSHGGLVRFTVAGAGTYRIALGAGAWLDVVSAATALPSVAHGHGPACSGIRKMVDFVLQPGVYTLQIAGSSAASLPLLIVKLP